MNADEPGEPIDGIAPEHLSEVEFQRWLAEAQADPVRSRELDFLADLTAAAQALPGQESATPVRSPGQRLVSWIAAAILLAGLGLGWWLSREDVPSSSVHELAQLSAPPYFAIDLRGQDDHSSEGFDQAMRRYQRTEYAQAAVELESWSAAHPEHLPARFYLAAALEQTGRTREAEREYERVGEAPGQLGEHALFRLANLRLRGGDPGGARIVLQRLLARDGPFRKNAEALLARLATR